MPISSPTNPTIRRLRRLRKRAWRERRAQLLLEGRRTVATALAAGVHLTEVMHTGAGDRELLDAARDTGARIHEVTRGVMAHLTDAASAPAVLGVGPLVESSIEQAIGSSVLVLNAVRDPATLGGSIGVAAAAGIPAVVVGSGSADVFAPKVVRAAGGAHYIVRIVRGLSAGDAVARLGGSVRTLSLAATGPAPWDIDLKGSLVLVVGGETGDERVAVPGVGGGEPPLTAATAVVLYEWLRQGEGDR